MTRKFIPYVVSLFFLLVSMGVYAAPVKIDFVAKIDFISDASNVLNGNVIVGDTISGTYTIDSATPDIDPSPDFANYHVQSPLPSGIGFNFNAGKLTFQPDNATANFDIFVFNSTTSDHYQVANCCGNVGTLSNGAVVSDIFVDLFDPNDKISSTVLADIHPNLNAFSSKIMEFSGNGSGGGNFFINATITGINPVIDSCEAPLPIDDTANFTATISSIHDLSNGLAGVINVGDTFSGSYTFNASTPDTDSGPENAVYMHPIGDPNFGFTLNMVGMTLPSDRSNSQFGIFITNTVYDDYAANVLGGNFSLPNGSVIKDFSLEVFDSTGQAISSSSLSEATPYPISAWETTNVFAQGVHADGSFFSFVATLDSINPGASSSAVPVSGPLQISPASGVFLPSQGFDAALILDAGLAPVINFTVELQTGGGIRFLNCFPLPAGASNVQTVLCPSVLAQLNPGTNTVSARVELADGTVLTTSANWELLAN